MVKVDYGDIVYINFDPSSGREIRKRRPAVVISNSLFNETTAFRILCPITHTEVRLYSIQVPEGLPVDGYILVHQMKSMDCNAREVEKIGKMPEETMAEVSNLVNLILSH